MEYLVRFGTVDVYAGGSKSTARMIATAFAHSYNVRDWQRMQLHIAAGDGRNEWMTTGILGHDAIEKVNDFFEHY